METVQNRWKRIIHVAKTKTGLDDESYRAILKDVAGVESSTEIKTWQQYQAVMAAFKKLGFTAKSAPMKNDQNERNPDWISFKQEKYIRGLWYLASRKKDEASLRHICKRITGGDDITFCKRADATKLILALRQIAEDEGFNPDKPSA